MPLTIVEEISNNATHNRVKKANIKEAEINFTGTDPRTSERLMIDSLSRFTVEPPKKTFTSKKKG